MHIQRKSNARPRLNIIEHLLKAYGSSNMENVIQLLMQSPIHQSLYYH